MDCRMCRGLQLSTLNELIFFAPKTVLPRRSMACWTPGPTRQIPAKEEGAQTHLSRQTIKTKGSLSAQGLKRTSFCSGHPRGLRKALPRGGWESVQFGRCNPLFRRHRDPLRV